MPSWTQLVEEIGTGRTHDIIRKNYIKNLSEVTGRNVIVYYSGWLQKTDVYEKRPQDFIINDADKNGFMATIHKLDKSKGLDLVLHTPGGDIAATESLVDYLRSVFHGDIRAIVPQLAMSCGTMIACACQEIVMGLHSSIGPTDPQILGLPAQSILEEWERASNDIKNLPHMAALWHPIISKYSPAFLLECERAVQWADDIVTEWLVTGMFKNEKDPQKAAQQVMQSLGSHAQTKTHNRHISIDDARQLGLKIVQLEDDPKLQDAVLSVHHACIYTLSDTDACKLIENNLGVSYINYVALR
jgi:hypothetical protein